MASETTTSNILLTGQSAYTKKTGSMINNGVIEKDTINESSEYSGYIAEGSKLSAAKVEDTTEYKNCERSIKMYLGEDYITGENLSIIDNCNNIQETLQPYAEKMQKIVNNIDMYKTTQFRIPEVISPSIELQFPKNSKMEWTLISPDASDIDYDILVSSDNKLKVHYQDHNLMINDIILDSSAITIQRINDTFHINSKKQLEIENASDTFILLPETNKGFIGNMGTITIYNDTTLHKLVPVVIVNKGSALLDEETNTIYDVDIKTIKLYEKANIWSKPIYTDIYITPNTGIELKFANYSSNSSSDKYIFGTGSPINISGNMTMFLNRYNRTFRYGRNPNVNSYVSTSVDCTQGSSTVITMAMNVQNSGKLVFSGGVSGTYNLSSITGDYKSVQPLCFPGYADAIDKDKTLDANDTYFYYCKVYEGRELVADLRMATTVSGTSILFDDITKKVYEKGKASFNVSGSVIDWR